MKRKIIVTIEVDEMDDAEFNRMKQVFERVEQTPERQISFRPDQKFTLIKQQTNVEMLPNTIKGGFDEVEVTHVVLSAIQ